MHLRRDKRPFVESLTTEESAEGAGTASGREPFLGPKRLVRLG